jgi:hypothetical protein
MLKRNGDGRDHLVPDYSAPLTTGEYKAYRVAIAWMAESVRLFNERAIGLSEIDAQMCQISEQVTARSMASSNDKWQFCHTLFKSAAGERVLCSRRVEGEERFGVIESSEAHLQDPSVQEGLKLLLTGNNAFCLLQDFIESERLLLGLLRKNIQTILERKLLETYPGQNLNRVVWAIMASCRDQSPVSKIDKFYVHG